MGKSCSIKKACHQTGSDQEVGKVDIVQVLEGMPSKSDPGNQPGPDPHVIQAYSSEPWWRGVGYNTILPTAAGRNASNLSSEGPNNSESNDDDQSQSSIRVNEEDDDTTKDSHASASLLSVRTCWEEQLPHNVASRMTTMHDGCLKQPPQLELVGHSIACATNPYQDPFYGEMMAIYGHQPPLVYPHLIGMHHARMPLPHEMAQEPVYVNPKQYHGILRRREARAKAEVEKKRIKVRKPYLHESRHQHALRRARSSGGRFAKKSEVEASEQTVAANAIGSVRRAGSRSSSDSAETWNSSNGQRDNRDHHVHNTFPAHDYVSGGNYYQNRSGMQTSKYHSQSGEGGEDGGCLGQQRGTISSSQASHRPLAIQ